VHTQRGLITIAEVQIGDQVWSFNEDTGESQWNRKKGSDPFFRAYPLFGIGGRSVGLLANDRSQLLGWGTLLPEPSRLTDLLKPTLLPVQAMTEGLIPLATEPLAVNLTDKLVTLMAGSLIDLQTGPALPLVLDEHLFSGLLLEHFSLGQLLDPTPPNIALQMATTMVNPGEYFEIQVSATDNGELVELSLTINDNPLSVNEQGQATFLAETPGQYTLVVTARDAAGNLSHKEVPLRVMAPNDTTPPTLVIHRPVEGSEITAPTPFIATIDDESLVNWKLSVQSASVPGATLLAQGGQPADNQAIATFDPTMLTNGLYQVIFEAEDANGQTSQIVQTYRVAGDLKVGNFSFTVEDAAIPMMGLPIRVLRTYDTRQKGQALDFGYGWSINLKSTKIEESRVPGEGWNLNQYGSRFSSQYCIEPLGSPQIAVTLGNGKVETFEVAMSPKCEYFQAPPNPRLVFIPKAGTFSKLESLDALSDDIYFDRRNIIDLSTGQPFNPTRYRLTTREGYAYELEQGVGIRKITDPNGHTLTYTNNGMIHSAGKSIQFERDAQGRITKLIDPNQNAISYQYDAAGDLVATTDAENQTVRYVYNSSHAMTEIKDPLNRKLVRNLYGDDGRLIGQLDADGNRINFTHKIEGREEIIRDRRGFITTYVYDDRGKIVSEIDAKGNVTYHTYDQDGNELTRTDPLKRTTTFTYDAHGNVLTKEDPEGYITESAYDDHDNLLREEDANGNVLSMSYDAQSNLLQATDPAKHIFKPVYDSDKRPTATLNGRGEPIMSFSYNNDGNPITQTDSLGNVTRITYDDNGNELSQLKTRTGADGHPVSLLTTTVYDKDSKLTQTTDAAGYVTSTEYDAAGQVVATVDKNEHRTTFEYDTQGRLIKTHYPDNTETRSTYDPNGNQISFTDRQGRTTQYRYDYQNRLIETVLPDQTSFSTEYDVVGRVLAQVDAKGNRTTFEYGKGEQPIKITNALNQSIQLAYNGVGNRTSVTDALAKTIRFEYDGVSRPTKVIYADKTFTQVVYDDLGRRTQDIDRAGNITRYEYDPVGRLIKVIDAKRGETSYLYDEVGNVINETDALGRTTSWTYDNLGRPLSRTLPLNMTESFTYDGNGNLLTHTDFKGDTISYGYDSNNRVVLETYPDESTISYTYTNNGQLETVTDSRGITHYTYDVRDRLFKVVHPDNTTLEYRYDDNSNRTAVITPSGQTTYTYDKLNRLTSVTTPNESVTSYAYDTGGNLTRVTRPNGTITAYHYDTFSRLVKLEHLDSEQRVIGSYEYTLNALGYPTQVIEPNGRIIAYTYDELGRLTKEDITDPINGDLNLAYRYNAVSNRVEIRVNGVITGHYSYDANNRLLTANDFSYSYDKNGNTLTQSAPEGTTTYAYDFKNRLVGVTTPNDSMTYAYDAAGIRVGSTVNGVATHYLVDKNRPYAQVLEERSSEGDLLTSYTYGNDLLRQKRGSETRYFHYDRLGSTKGLTDDNQTVTDVYNSDAFGNPLQSTGTTPNHYRFTGEQHDPQTGLIYLRARYYNPATGRFLTQDTWNGRRGEPISRHKYLYANANPVVFTDPTGHFSIGSLNSAMNMSHTLVRLARPNFGHIMKKRIQGKKFDVFKATQNLLGNPKGHHFVYIELSLRSGVIKLKGEGWRYDIGANYDPEKWTEVKIQLLDFFDGNACDTTYGGTLDKEFTTRPKIERLKGKIEGKPTAKFTSIQLIGWEAVAYLPWATGGFTYTFKDKVVNGWNCQSWTAAALAYAKLIERLPLYP
jgi:RHS repeat-associated protein